MFEILKNQIGALAGRLNPLQPTNRGWTLEHQPVDSDKTAQGLQASAGNILILGGGVKAAGRAAPVTYNVYPAIGTEQFSEKSFTPPKPKRAIRIQRPILEDQQFQILQKWEGMVIHVGDDSFIGKLKDLTNEGPDEEVEIGFDEVLTGDQELIEEGSAFYWSIGHLQMGHGQRFRASVIRFRRVPGWTEEDINAAKLQAASDGSFYNLDCGNQPA